MDSCVLCQQQLVGLSSATYARPLKISRMPVWCPKSLLCWRQRNYSRKYIYQSGYYTTTTTVNMSLRSRANKRGRPSKRADSSIMAHPKLRELLQHVIIQDSEDLARTDDDYMSEQEDSVLATSSRRAISFLSHYCSPSSVNSKTSLSDCVDNKMVLVVSLRAIYTYNHRIGKYIFPPWWGGYA